MIVGYGSTYSHYLQFLKSMQFSCTGILPSLLNLFPVSLFFLYIYELNCFLNFSYFIISVQKCNRFFILSLYPVILQNLFISLMDFGGVFMFYVYKITSHANNQSVTFSFPIRMTFYFSLNCCSYEFQDYIVLKW